MDELKKSTQIKVRIGPCVAVADGFTPVTNVTLGGADEAELLKHNGAATVDMSAATWAAVAGADGWYDLTLTVSHTGTLGSLRFVLQDDDLILPIDAKFSVVTANYWDTKYGTDRFNVEVEVSRDKTGYTLVNKTGFSLSAAAIDAIHDEEVDNNGSPISLRQTMRCVLAFLAAITSGGGGSELVFRDLTNSKDRIKVTVDANKNRISIDTLDLT